MTSLELHAPASHGPHFFFEAIDAAIGLLVERAEGGQQADVRLWLHPVAPPPTRFARLREAVSAVTRRMERTAAALHRAGDISYYDRVQVCRGVATIATSVGSVTVGLSSIDRATRSAASASAVSHWRRLLDLDGAVRGADLLRLEHRGIRIGDLVASTALRCWVRAGGSLARCENLLPCLIDAIAMSEHAWTIPVRQGRTYVLGSEPTYVQATYERVLHARGASALRMPYYRTSYVATGSGSKLENPWVALPVARSALTPAAVAEATRYLGERLDQPDKHFWFMDGFNRSDAVLADSRAKPLRLQDGELIAAVFLHSLVDGQYFFGCDGFDDLYHWTTFTIDRLVANERVDRIFVKEHPTSNSRRYRGDRRAGALLRARYRSVDRVVWLRRDTSPKAVVGPSRVMGITHHGSVAEELVAQGIPTIAATTAPWSDSYRFVRAWRSIEEYGRMLDALSHHAWEPVTRAETRELHRFVSEYRLDQMPGPREVIHKIAAWQGAPHNSRISNEQYDRMVEMLRRLGPNQHETRELLEYLVGQARSGPRCTR